MNLCDDKYLDAGWSIPCVNKCRAARSNPIAKPEDTDQLSHIADAGYYMGFTRQCAHSLSHPLSKGTKKIPLQLTWVAVRQRQLNTAPLGMPIILSWDRCEFFTHVGHKLVLEPIL